MSEGDLQTFLGHSSLTMTRIYAEQVNSEDAIKPYGCCEVGWRCPAGDNLSCIFMFPLSKLIQQASAVT